MLKGKIIISTRPTGSEDLIGNALENLGAAVLSMPLIETFQIPISQKSQSVILENNTYQWLVFTSRNGVESLFGQLGSLENIEVLPFKTAVFGRRTAAALHDKGFNPDLVVQSNTSADLLNELLPKLQTNEKVLLVLGDLASNLLKDGLQQKVSVDRLDVYRTEVVQSVETKMLNRISENNYDLILFTSPSGFKSFMHHTIDKIDLQNLKIACLGPTTEEAILNEGLVPLIVAKPSGKIGLLKGMENYFAKSQYENV
mgnify:FL=1